MELKQKIDQFKARGLRVMKAKIAGVECVYRGISRSEFSELQLSMSKSSEDMRKNSPDGDIKEAQQLKLKDRGEENLVMKGLVSPELESELDLAALPAGVIPVLAELIMQASGFGDDVQPEEL